MMVKVLAPLDTIPVQFEEIFLELEQVLSSPKKVGVAVSGGSDSMLLSYLLVSFFEKKGRNSDFLYFFHCNHGVRHESDLEAQELTRIFAGWQFEVITRERGLDAREEELRTWRYEVFQKKMLEKGIDMLFLGHNLTDRIETSLLNMVRGCGVRGFLAMREVASHHLLGGKSVVRPLLSLSKQEIVQLCTDLSLPYFIDKSNFDLQVSFRNVMRMQFVFPLGELKFEDHSQGILRESQFFQSWRQIYASLEKADFGAGELIPFEVNPMVGLDRAFCWQRDLAKKVEKADLVQIFSVLDIQLSKGELELWKSRFDTEIQGYREYGDWTVFLCYGGLYFFHGESRFWEKNLDQERVISSRGIQDFGPLSLKIEDNMVGGKLRFPRKGDHFQGKTLRKRMVNRKIPIFLRNAVPLVEKEGNIIVVFETSNFSF